MKNLLPLLFVTLFLGYVTASVPVEHLPFAPQPVFARVLSVPTPISRATSPLVLFSSDPAHPWCEIRDQGTGKGIRLTPNHVESMEMDNDHAIYLFRSALEAK